MTGPTRSLLTMLFTDIVGSTELLDNEGQQATFPLFRDHRHLLSSMIESHGGTVRGWLGDGMMGTFEDPGSAVTAAVGLQRRLQSIPGEPLKVRMGLNTGQVEVDEEGVIYGTPIVIASRLCDSAGGGEIRCTDVVRALLAGHASSDFSPLGPMQLKGLAEEFNIYAIDYQPPRGRDARARAALVERERELEQLERSMLRVAGGSPTLVVVEGEAGVGKSRLVQEFLGSVEHATYGLGRCQEGDLGGMHSGLSRALGQLIDRASTELWERPRMTEALEVLADVVPFEYSRGIRIAQERSRPSVGRLAPVNAAERELQIVELIVVVLEELEKSGPIVLAVDDMHLADRTTVDLFQRLVRRLDGVRIMVIAAIRSGELTPEDRLSVVMEELARPLSPEHIHLAGLSQDGTQRLTADLLSSPVVGTDANELWEHTGGNPFYIHELMADRLSADGDGSPATHAPPRNVRDVVATRVRRLSPEAQSLLQRAATVAGPFPLAPVANAAGLEPEQAFAALDEILESGLATSLTAWTYEFVHGLTRQSVQSMVNPARASQIEWEVANALAALAEDQRRPWLTTIARLYHSSRHGMGQVPVWPALDALAEAERSFSYRQQADLARLALETGDLDTEAEADLRRREALALVASVEPRGVDAVVATADLLIENGEHQLATEFLADGVTAVRISGYESGDIHRLAVEALSRAGDNRTPAWAVIARFRLMLEPESSDYPGILTPDRLDEINELLAAQSEEEAERWDALPPPGPTGAHAGSDRDPEVRLYYAGDYVGTRSVFAKEAEQGELEGRIRQATVSHCSHARSCISLGDFAAAQQSLNRAGELRRRLPEQSDISLHISGAKEDLRRALGEAPERAQLDYWGDVLQRQPETWALAAVRAGVASAMAEVGDDQAARRLLDALVRPIDLSRGDQITYLHVIWHAVETAYLIEADDLVDFLRSNVESKVFEPDFRAPMSDSRMALGRLAFIEGDLVQSIGWYELATEVLSSSRARPLAAIARLELARTLETIGGDEEAMKAEVARRTALAEFEALGMRGWLRKESPVT